MENTADLEDMLLAVSKSGTDAYRPSSTRRLAPSLVFSRVFVNSIVHMIPTVSSIFNQRMITKETLSLAQECRNYVCIAERGDINFEEEEEDNDEEEEYEEEGEEDGHQETEQRIVDDSEHDEMQEDVEINENEDIEKQENKHISISNEQETLSSSNDDQQKQKHDNDNNNNNNNNNQQISDEKPEKQKIHSQIKIDPPEVSSTRKRSPGRPSPPASPRRIASKPRKKNKSPRRLPASVFEQFNATQNQKKSSISLSTSTSISSTEYMTPPIGYDPESSSELRSQLIAVQRDLEESKHRNTALQSEKEELLNKVADLTILCNELQSNIDNLNKRYEEVMQTNLSLKVELSDTKSKLSSISSQSQSRIHNEEGKQEKEEGNEEKIEKYEEKEEKEIVSTSDQEPIESEENIIEENDEQQYSGLDRNNEKEDVEIHSEDESDAAEEHGDHDHRRESSLFSENRNETEIEKDKNKEEDKEEVKQLREINRQQNFEIEEYKRQMEIQEEELFEERRKVAMQMKEQETRNRELNKQNSTLQNQIKELEQKLEQQQKLDKQQNNLNEDDNDNNTTVQDKNNVNESSSTVESIHSSTIDELIRTSQSVEFNSMEDKMDMIDHPLFESETSSNVIARKDLERNVHLLEQRLAAKEQELHVLQISKKRQEQALTEHIKQLELPAMNRARTRNYSVMERPQWEKIESLKPRKDDDEEESKDDLVQRVEELAKENEKLKKRIKEQTYSDNFGDVQREIEELRSFIKQSTQQQIREKISSSNPTPRKKPRDATVLRQISSRSSTMGPKPIRGRGVSFRKQDVSSAEQIVQDTDEAKSGYLCKEGKKIKNWKRRWFVIRDGKLSYYSGIQDTRPLGIVDLYDARVSEAPEKENAQRLYCFQVNTPKRIYYMCASSEDDRYDWMTSINRTVMRLSRQEESRLEEKIV